jgi:hypothetical protein
VHPLFCISIPLTISPRRGESGHHLCAPDSQRPFLDPGDVRRTLTSAVDWRVRKLIRPSIMRGPGYNNDGAAPHDDALPGVVRRGLFWGSDC